MYHNARLSCLRRCRVSRSSFFRMSSLRKIHRVDLTAASEVHLLEPQWNPAIEEQALARVHRMGQTKEVHTFRYLAQDTIEEVRFVRTAELHRPRNFSSANSFTIEGRCFAAKEA